MSATDELRRMLDERGVGWSNPIQMEGSTFTRWHDADNTEWTASEIHHRNSKLRIGASSITPEQAIAATLGGGMLTAEHVREAWCGNLKRDCLYDPPTPDWQAIADELNARAERTCKFVSSKGFDYPPVCSACGYELGIYDCEWFDDGTYGYSGNFCPNCGARVEEK